MDADLNLVPPIPTLRTRTTSVQAWTQPIRLLQRAMRFDYLRTLSLSVVIILVWLPQISCSHFDARDIKLLSDEQIEMLVAAVDPVKNIDTQNPESHLSKILIPRPGVLCIRF